jgi:hypothetical protein
MGDRFVRPLAIREIRLARIALSERLRDKNLTGGSMPPVAGTLAAVCWRVPTGERQLMEPTLKRRSPRGVFTTAVSPDRLPRSAPATGDSIESLPSATDASRDETSV